MKCQNCGATITNTAKFCKHCGEKQNNDHASQYNYSYNYSNKTEPKYDINADHRNQYNYSYNYSNTTTPSYNMNASHNDQFNYSYNYNTYNTVNGDDKYIAAYVGPNYENFKNVKFSIPLFLFGAAYLFYRKLWLYAILYIILSLVAEIYLGEMGSILVIGVNIFIALKFNNFYLRKAEEKVEQIKQMNLDKTTQELIDICKKKGGTSFKSVIIAMILIPFIIILAVIAYTVYYNIDYSNYTETNENMITEENKSEVIETDNLLGYLTYTLPEGFIKSYNDANYVSYRYTDYSTNATCRITISLSKYTNLYPTAEKYIEKNLLTSDETEVLNSTAPITYNGTEWKYAHLESTKRSKTIYAIMQNEIIYSVETEDYKIDERDNIICNQKYGEFLKTLQFKKRTNSI